MLRQNAMTGIAFKLSSVCVFLGMSSLLKASEGVPSGQLVFFRSFFAILPIIAYLIWKGELGVGLTTKHPVSHLLRGLVGTGGMMTGFFALTQLPLAEAITISYATPLLIVVFSAVFYHEQVRLYRWSAVLVGLIGVVIIIWPRLTVFSGGISDMSGATLGAASALVAAGFAATAMVLVRKLVETERSATIVLYFSLTSSVFGLATLPFGWVMPTTEQFALLIGAGIFGGIGQILLTESYRHADMSVVAPFEYASLILSVAIGYVIFHDIPTIEMLVGGAIVVGSGLFIIYREHKLGLERKRASEVSPPQ
ncbi:MAG TPA: DMT family transporter [Devosia sp.]|jgi:drug/metabolite transporter (DMT)-like permease|uniref:DMT family transporter n=1 Tax=Devosia sp. TaxID=1871048 RepID=UPI002DDD0CA6|nr:DMT family transporter [Devosia sp.]HEV2518841.1 DMT family transporter [Devosia sp.]